MWEILQSEELLKFGELGFIVNAELVITKTLYWLNKPYDSSVSALLSASSGILHGWKMSLLTKKILLMKWLNSVIKFCFSSNLPPKFCKTRIYIYRERRALRYA